jgi:type II secretory pathway predicted ATPase ExeA
VLVGQPELREILAMAGLRQLRQRISINCRIVPLTKEDTREYIFHRLEVAGNRDAVAFTDGTVDVIYEYCRGIPRLTNILCDFLLLTAFNEDTRDVDSAMVHDIAKDLEFESLYWGKKDSPSKQSVDYTALLNALGIGDMKQQ